MWAPTTLITLLAFWCLPDTSSRKLLNPFTILTVIPCFETITIPTSRLSGTSSKRNEASEPSRMGGTSPPLASSSPNERAEKVPVSDTRTSDTRDTISNDISGGMDLLEALKLNNTRPGVERVPGFDELKPAYYFKGEQKDLHLDQESFGRAAALIRGASEYTISVLLRQEKENSGTILAFSRGTNRYLELQSSGRKKEIRLHYYSRSNQLVQMETFRFGFADGTWHRLALSVSGSQVELFGDCKLLHKRIFTYGPPDTNFTVPRLQLWVGQRNANQHSVFKGALQDLKLIPGPHGYLYQCPDANASCPTCGEFSILQNTVEQLMHKLNELSRRLAAAEDRISQVEECECQKSCRVNGTVHQDGATWEKGCEHCSCVQGEITCRPALCAPVKCSNPVTPEGECCPVCLKECFMKGKLYDHGTRLVPKECTVCNCNNGVFRCVREFECPPLPCPVYQQISVAEECCKYCAGVDYCAKGHDCHANASCLNLQTKYACNCNTGFQGDGHKCTDVDECKQKGGLDGHHCNANTRCVNVVGGYVCECLPGYHRMDKFNCAELDECATGRHSCSENAHCINTVGSYLCQCKEGYEGDGYSCKPLCEQTCQNGGECVAPGKCSCRRGYIGNSCELDLDECASDLHRCHHSSTCFNMPGWYYCRCKPGYRSALHESNQGTQCIDIDECNDQTSERRHTCHPTARCINTEGGYECSCAHRDSQQTVTSVTTDLHNLYDQEECKLSCWYEGREIPNGDSFLPAGNQCRRCDCNNGVVTCSEPSCDCSAPGSRRDKCCPQCDPAASCRHQELDHLVFRSGERWIYQCQTCECLYGEIDCWQMECPPVTCSNPITEDGDCCPRCKDDPCARELPKLDSANGTISEDPRPCSYAGVLHESGTSWQGLHDKCTTCECKDGQLFCSYDYRCSGNLEDAVDSLTPGAELSTSVGPSGANLPGSSVDSSEGTLPTNEPYQSVLGLVTSPSELRTSTGYIRNRHWDARTTVLGYTTDSNDGNDFSRGNADASTSSVGVLERGKVTRRRTGYQVSSWPGRRSSLPPTSATTATTTRTTTTATTNTPTRATSATKARSIAIHEQAANSLRDKNLQTARYSTSRYLSDRKTRFASDRRRRPGPRLVNGNPTGHDAT